MVANLKGEGFNDAVGARLWVLQRSFSRVQLLTDADIAIGVGDLIPSTRSTFAANGNNVKRDLSSRSRRPLQTMNDAYPCASRRGRVA